jgi:hypothetical protein
MDEFKAMINQARLQGVTLYLFISPTHAWEQEQIRARGEWNNFKDWKRELVKIVDDANQETHGGDQSQVTLWDFSGYNSVTIENVPPLGTANANMQYFWEWSHYKTVVGGWILERILDAEQTQSHIPWDFGVRLTRKNIEAHLADIDHAREVYLRDNPEDVAFINLIVQ